MRRAWRVLRVAVSVVGFAACLFFAASWVRSYWRSDAIVKWHSPTSRLQFQSRDGVTTMYVFPDPVPPGVHFVSDPWDHGLRLKHPPYLLKLRQVSLSQDSFMIPHWTWMAAFGLIGAAPWLRWRFSLRGLLIVTAVAAVLFAVIIVV